MTAPFDCEVCHRRIGRTKTHWLIPGYGVCCVGCAMTQQRQSFTLLCDTPGTFSGSRAGLALHSPRVRA